MDPGMDSITDDPREDITSQNPEENPITEDLKEYQVLQGPHDFCPTENSFWLFDDGISYHRVTDGDKFDIRNVVLVGFAFMLIT